MLGPKPKKPVEEKNIASALLTGTKRKLQALWGSGRSASPASPKRRKMNSVDTVATKVKNALSQVENARDQAERDAEEHTRQIASRENRAMRRSAPEPLKRMRTHTSRGKLQPVKTSRKVVFQHTVVKSISRADALTKGTKRSKGLKPNARPVTPTLDASDLDSEDESVNITPASLRSASKKATRPSSETSRANSASKPAFQKRTVIAAPRAIQRTGAGVKKTYRVAASKTRHARI